MLFTVFTKASSTNPRPGRAGLIAAPMIVRTVRDYSEIQRRQWRVTVPLTVVIFLFYAALIAFLVLIVALAMQFLRGSTSLITSGDWFRS